jgi:hypothetical protein
LKAKTRTGAKLIGNRLVLDPDVRKDLFGLREGSLTADEPSESLYCRHITGGIEEDIERPLDELTIPVRKSVGIANEIVSALGVQQRRMYCVIVLLYGRSANNSDLPSPLRGHVLPPAAVKPPSKIKASAIEDAVEIIMSRDVLVSIKDRLPDPYFVRFEFNRACSQGFIDRPKVMAHTLGFFGVPVFRQILIGIPEDQRFSFVMGDLYSTQRVPTQLGQTKAGLPTTTAGPSLVAVQHAFVSQSIDRVRYRRKRKRFRPNIFSSPT